MGQGRAPVLFSLCVGTLGGRWQLLDIFCIFCKICMKLKKTRFAKETDKASDPTRQQQLSPCMKNSAQQLLRQQLFLTPTCMRRQPELCLP